MQEFLAWLSRIIDSWKFWIVICPWEIGVRIRFGKHALALKPGPHLRIPFIDSITLVNTRLRIDGTPPVTVPGRSANFTRYKSATVGYTISDPLKAMMNFGLPNSVVISRTQAEMASKENEEDVLSALREFFNSDTGVSIRFVKFVENVEVKSYRIINGGSWNMTGHETITPPGGQVRY